MICNLRVNFRPACSLSRQLSLYRLMMRSSVVLLTLLTIGCGDSSPYPLAGPSSVVPPLRANVAGQYAGTMSYTSGTQRGALTILVRLRQSGQTFEGDWTTYQDGTITGTVSGVLNTLNVPTTLSARWTMDAPSSAGGRCAGSGQSSGTAFPITLSAPTLSLGSCVGLRDVTWRLEMDKGSL